LSPSPVHPATSEPVELWCGRRHGGGHGDAARSHRVHRRHPIARVAAHAVGDGSGDGCRAGTVRCASPRPKTSGLPLPSQLTRTNRVPSHSAHTGAVRAPMDQHSAASTRKTSSQSHCPAVHLKAPLRMRCGIAGVNGCHRRTDRGSSRMHSLRGGMGDTQWCEFHHLSYYVASEQRESERTPPASPSNRSAGADDGHIGTPLLASWRGGVSPDSPHQTPPARF
jgi:hypothetical protein